MPLLTLLSDFGSQDAFVGIAKGIIHNQIPEFTVFDISHDITIFNKQQAAYILQSAYKHYNEKTIHLILVDFDYDKNNQIVLATQNGHYFIAPNNGILSLFLNQAIAETWLLNNNSERKNFWTLFKDIIVSCKDLQNKTPAELNLKKIELPAFTGLSAKTINNDLIECHVVHIDHYENVILNIQKNQFEAIRNNRNFRIEFMQEYEIRKLSEHYSDVKENQYLCRFNDAGFLEIAVNKQKAASLLGFKMKSEKHLFYNTIKIYFE